MTHTNTIISLMTRYARRRIPPIVLYYAIQALGSLLFFSSEFKSAQGQVLDDLIEDVEDILPIQSRTATTKLKDSAGRPSDQTDMLKDKSREFEVSGSKSRINVVTMYIRRGSARSEDVLNGKD